MNQRQEAHVGTRSPPARVRSSGIGQVLVRLVQPPCRVVLPLPNVLREHPQRHGFLIAAADERCAGLLVQVLDDALISRVFAADRRDDLAFIKIKCCQFEKL